MDQDLRLSTSSGVRNLTIRDSDLKLTGATRKNNLESCILLISSWLALLSDSPVDPEKKPFKTFREFRDELLNDLKGTVLRFSSLSHKLVSQHYIMGQHSLIGDFIDEFKKTPIFFEYCRYYKTGDPAILKFIYTFLNFGKKFEFDDDDFKSTALRSWLEIEHGLNDLHLNDLDVTSLRRIIKILLPALDDGDLWPKHGPGSVADAASPTYIEKHSYLVFDKVIDRFIFHGYIGKYGQAEDEGFSAAKVIPNLAAWSRGLDRPRLPARLRFVPKNLKVARSICMEPTTLMFFQQAYMRKMVEAVKASRLSRFIKFDNQERNQELAYHGSLNGDIDTLDLSAASDSLSLDLVKKVFQPNWLIPMIATRSSEVELPDGSIIPIKKFAPMGSALCFPTQCIIFACVSIYAMCQHRIAASPLQPVEVSDLDVLKTLDMISDHVIDYNTSDRYQPLAVYGDDICCDGDVTVYIKSILSRLGFVVNEDKSFVGSQAFRESCGKFFLAGHDITPLYFRVKEVRRSLTPNHIMSHVHLINASWSYKFKHLYRHSLRLLREWGRPKKFGNFSIPFVFPTSTEFGIYSSKPVNSHLQTRESIDLQREEWKVWTISSERSLSSNSMHEFYLHMRWWATRGVQELAARAAGHRVTVGNRVKWRWTPLY